MKIKVYASAIAAAWILTAYSIANATPLASGTALKIDPGVGSAVNTPCIVGSCYSQELSPGIILWRDMRIPAIPATHSGLIAARHSGATLPPDRSAATRLLD